MENSIGLREKVLLLIATLFVGIFIGFQLPKPPKRGKVVFQNTYRASALVFTDPVSGQNQYMGCTNDTTFVELRTDSCVFVFKGVRHRYETLKAIDDKGLYYALDKNGAALQILRIKRKYMPAGKEYELLHVDTGTGKILMNAFEQCPSSEHSAPDNIEILH